MEGQRIKVCSHVVKICRAGERDHAGVEGKPKNDGRDCSAVPFGYLCHLRTCHHIRVGSKQRESLVMDVVGNAELSN